MSDIFQIVGVGLLAGKQQLETISVNAASASLPGYRRHVAPGRAFDAAMAAAPAPVLDAARSAPQQVNLHPGAIIATGRALDLSIDGDDLFFALTDGTQTWLTRGGGFRLNEEGALVGEQGLRVVGTHGDVRLPGSDVAVGADGRIAYQGEVVATLQLFRPNDRSSLRAGQGALLESLGGIQPAEAGAGRVRGGSLEASNTDAGREMLGVMALTRQFEGLTHVVQGYDALLGRVIQKLGEV